MMHVLWTPSWWPSSAAPLDGSFFAEQVGMLRDAGVETGVICVRGGKPQDFFSANVGAGREKMAASALVPLGIVPGDAALIGRVARRLGRAYAAEFGIPDVIHAHSVFPGVIAARALAEEWGVPYGITEHRPSTMRRNPQSFRYGIIRAAVAQAAFRNSVSPDMAAKLSRYYGAPFGVLALPIAEQFFERPLRDHRGSGFTFIHVSNLDDNKRLPLTLAAFEPVHREFPDTRFLVVGGQGEDLAVAREYVASLPCRDAIEIHGAVMRSDLPGLMETADCLVLASAREAGGVVLGEAQSLGIPCIVTSTAAGRFMVSGETGSVVPIDDKSALTRAMRAMVETGPRNRAAIREVARARFSPETFVNTLLPIYVAAIEAAECAGRED